MISEKKVQQVVRRLVDVYQPLVIFIFGSMAWGKPSGHSDLDILIIVDHSDEPPYKRILKGLKSLRGLKIPKDLLVYTREEFEEMAVEKASLCYKIKHEGIRAYERKAA